MNEEQTAIAEEQAVPATLPQNANSAETASDEATTKELVEGDELQEGEQEEGESQEPELADIEYEGKAYKLPPELKDALLRNADYTRKTQEVAEMRKAIAAKEAEAQANFNLSQEVIEAKAQAVSLDNALKQYENVNWQQLEAEDPIAAMSHWRQFQQLQQQRGQVAQYLDKTQAELSEKAAQATEARLRETAQFAQKELKGWTPDLDVKIAQFATNDLGFTAEELRSSLNPQVYKTLYLAHIGQQALQKQATPTQQQNAPAPKPLQKVATRTSPPAGLDDRLSQDEWLKRRQAQLKRG